MQDYTSVTFTWEGDQQPGLWCPALGPGVFPMEKVGTSWEFRAQLPQGTCFSWAVVPDVAQVSPLSPALLDAALRAPDPVVPSLFRLIGTDSSLCAEPNVAMWQLPGSPELDWSVLRKPAPVLAGDRVASGHRVHFADAQQSQVLFLDGEVMQRLHGDFLAMGIFPMYVHNSGVAQRLGDFADPVGFASAVGAHIEHRPEVVVGVSAAAFAACALAVELGAQRVVLLSPTVIAGVDTARNLVASLLERGISVEVGVGSEENRGEHPGKSVFGMAQGLVDGLRSAGGNATFSVFPGGHDVAAWRPALARFLG